MKVIKIIQSNTSTLDTILPFLWYIRNNNANHDVKIFYAVTNKSQVLRDDNFISEFCLKNKIHQYDLSDFLPKLIKPLFRLVFRNSYNDSFPIRKVFSSQFKLSYLLNVGNSIKKKIEFFIVDLLIKKNKLKEFFDVPIVLFDIREKSNFCCRELIFQNLYLHKPLTYLIPHAPHDITPYSEITSFDQFGEKFPSFCKYWISFKHSKSYTKFGQRKKDFKIYGYPPFDSAWVNKIKKEKKIKKERNCLILLRNNLDKKNLVPKGEFFTVSYDHNINLLNRIASSINSLNLSKVNYIIKPHPKASKPRIMELLDNSNIKNWTISYDSFYEQINKVDFVISNFTTSNLLTVFFGLPTIIVEDYIHKYVNDEWDVLKKMYKGLELYLSSNENMSKKIQFAISNYRPEKDINFLRSFFEDNNLNNAFETIKKQINEG